MVSTSILGEVIGGRFMFPETTEEVDADARAIFWAAVLGLVASFGMYGFYKLYSYVSAGRSCHGQRSRALIDHTMPRKVPHLAAMAASLCGFSIRPT